MPEHEAMTLNFKPFQRPTTDADFTYKITPNTISITDTKRARRSVTEDIEAVLRKIEYWHQGSIARFKIMYRDDNGVWDGVWRDGQHPSFLERRRDRSDKTTPSAPLPESCAPGPKRITQAEEYSYGTKGRHAGCLVASRTLHAFGSLLV